MSTRLVVVVLAKSQLIPWGCVRRVKLGRCQPGSLRRASRWIGQDSCRCNARPSPPGTIIPHCRLRRQFQEHISVCAQKVSSTRWSARVAARRSLQSLLWRQVENGNAVLHGRGIHAFRRPGSLTRNGSCSKTAKHPPASRLRATAAQRKKRLRAATNDCLIVQSV